MVPVLRWIVGNSFDHQDVWDAGEFVVRAYVLAGTLRCGPTSTSAAWDQSLRPAILTNLCPMRITAKLLTTAAGGLVIVLKKSPRLEWFKCHKSPRYVSEK